MGLGLLLKMTVLNIFLRFCSSYLLKKKTLIKIFLKNLSMVSFQGEQNADAETNPTASDKHRSVCKVLIEPRVEEGPGFANENP